MARRNWARDELIIAFNLYCKIPFGQFHAKNRRIIELAKLLDRTPSAVAMKLVNFASYDPAHQERGVVGLRNASKADQRIWNEFNDNWAALAVESEKAFQLLRGEEMPGNTTVEDQAEFNFLRLAGKETEAEQVVKVRLGQAFFRQTVLASYATRCCICNLPEEALLVASHIVPWAARPELRLNPRNGLCMCALHDRAFDRGLVTFEANLTLKLGRRLERHLPDNVVEKMFVAYRGQPLHMPDKFSPGNEYLSYHREEVFQSA